jgi:uncharacterized protein DUF6232
MSTEETTYYDEGGIKITSARAVLGGKTYSMSNITSVSASAKAPSLIVPLLLWLAGAFFVVMAVGNGGWVNWVIAAVLIAFGIFIWRVSPTMHTVRIGSASGEANAYSTNSKVMIDKIVAAINTAIIKRG